MLFHSTSDIWHEDRSNGAEPDPEYERDYSAVHEGIWPSRKGDLEIRDMETRHIFNCIDMLNRKIENDGPDARSAVYLRMFRSELKRRKIFCKEYLQAIEARKGR